MLNAGRVRDIASGVSSELWHGRRLRHAKHRIAYLPSSEQLISFQLINRSLESSRERANFFLQQSKNSNLLSLSIRIECSMFERNSRDERIHRRMRWVGLECRQPLETEFHSASLNIGWRRRGTRDEDASIRRGIFCFTMRAAAQVALAANYCGAGTYATKRPISTAMQRTLPRDRYIGVVSCIALSDR